MKIAFGCDHAGFAFRGPILDYLRRQNYKVIDYGTFSTEPCDYPDLAEKVAVAVAKGKAKRGILVCGTGVGMSIAANKISGVRAAVCWSEEVARLVAEHNWANILCLSGRLSKEKDVIRWLAIWLESKFARGRHQRRVRKIQMLEKKYCGVKR